MRFSQKTSKGVTLIELMVTIAIIAIVVAVALPTYREHIARSNRADAKAALLNNAQFMERRFTETNCYQGAGTNCSTENIASINGSLPWQQTPSFGTALYTISLSDASTDESSFLLQAVPVTGESMDGDECGTLTLNHLGVKGISGGTYSVAQCWNK